MAQRFVYLRGLIICLAIANQAFAQGAKTVYSTFLPGTTYQCCAGANVSGPAATNLGAFVGQSQTAAAFTPTANYDLTQIDVALYFPGSPNTSGFILSLNEDAGGVPGKTIESWTGLAAPTLPVGTSSVVQTVNPVSTVQLIAGTQYWIVATPSASNTFDVWAEDVFTIKPGPGGRVATNTGNGWSVVNLSFGAVVFDVLGVPAVLGPTGSLAQVASGGGWTTTITIVNTSAAASQAVLYFFDNNGNPLQLPLSFPQNSSTHATVASTYSATLNAGAELVIQSSGPTNLPTMVGSAYLSTTGGISAFAVFTQVQGGRQQDAVVPLEDRTPGAFVLSFDNTANYSVGVALANIADQPGNVGVVIRDDTGALLLTSSIGLPAQGHTSFSLPSNYLITAQRRGTVEFDTPSSGQISVLGLRFNPTGAFSSIPVIAK